MGEAAWDEVGLWLRKAESDLDSARVLLERGLADTGVYHCQQAAEKALKAYLAWRETPLVKVHDLTALVKQCVPLDASFDSLMELAELLTPYATAFRYPGDLLIPDPVDAQEALQSAEQVLAFVLSTLPEQYRNLIKEGSAR